MDYVIKNANILDGTKDMKLQTDMTVCVKDGKITSICKSNEFDASKSKMPNNAKVFDLKGKYLIPGLINMHAHLASKGAPTKPSDKPKDYKKIFEMLSKHKIIMWVYKLMQKSYAKTQLLSGTTTVRAVGGVLDIDGKIREEIKDGKFLGPRLIVANTAVSVPGGHFAGSLATESENPEMARNDVKKIAATNPDFIKVMITGGVMDATEEGEPGALRMSPEIAKATVEEANKLGYYTSAHVEGTEGLRVALESGIKTIEHGAKLSEKEINLFKEKDAILISTMSPVVPYVLFDESVSHCGDLGRSNGQIVFDGMIDCAKKCLENNITVGIGTDTGCPFITHYNMWRELYYFDKYICNDKNFALHTGTLVNAQIAGIDDITGSIETGKNAEMIVVDDNPTKDLSTIKNVKYVFMGKDVLTNPKIKKDKLTETELDKFM